MNQEKITELKQTICRDYGNIAGMVVRKNGKTVYEGYFNGTTAGHALHVFSVTKSVVGVLIGLPSTRAISTASTGKCWTFSRITR